MIRVELDDRGLRKFRKKVKTLAAGGWEKEVHRGLIDAGRRTTVRVAKAAQGQMAAKSYGFVRNKTRATSADLMQYRIFSPAGGARIEEYKGLRSVKNVRLSSPEPGGVSSGVWNNPRTFKRSFKANGGFFAMLPGGEQSTVAPRMLWTYGNKPGQPRDAAGKFMSSGVTYGKIRRLFGPALRDELVKDQSRATFEKVAPMILEQKIVPRLAKLITF